MPARDEYRRWSVTRLELQAWRNFSRRTEMHLGGRAFFIGPNASGKSNILDALRFLRDVATEGLQGAVSVRGGISEFRSLHTRRLPGVRIAVDIGSREHPARWSYQLHFRNHPQRHVPIIEGERVCENVTARSRPPPLYALVEEHFPRLLQRLESEGVSLAHFVKEEFEAYLKSGRLEYGFLRVKCDACRQKKRVAFRCKRRGFRPSCGARRMVETAAHLVAHVLPEQPIRQWVLSFPYPLRKALTLCTVASHPLAESIAQLSGFSLHRPPNGAIGGRHALPSP